MKRSLLTLLLSVFLIPVGFAQNRFEVQVPDVVGIGEVFKVVFTLNLDGKAKVSDFTPPSFEGMNHHSGPYSSQMQGYNSVNGKSSSYFQVSYTYVLSVDKEGKYTIAPAEIKAGGKTYRTEPFTFEAVKNGNSEKNASGGPITSDDIFLKFSLNKTKVVKGEPIIATLELYTTVPIVRPLDQSLPEFNGFWSQDLTSGGEVDFRKKHYNDRIYDVGLLKKYILLPQQSGTLEIDPAMLLLEVRMRDAAATNALDDFFYGSVRTVRKRLVSEKIKVQVDDLPEGAPKSFSGAVGRFNISAELSDREVNLHDAVSLVVTVSGSGNLNLLSAPKVDFPEDFELYDVKSESRTSSTSGGTQGSVVFEYPFIPRLPGNYVVGPIDFSYFDLQSGSYKTVSVPEMQLEVKGSVGAEPVSGSRESVNRQAVKNIGEDIRFIEVRDLSLAPKGSLFAGSLLYFLIMALIFLLTILVYFILKKVVAARKDVVSKRSRRAMKIAAARLKNAHDYEDLHIAILGYIADKLHMPLSELSKDNIGDRLASTAVGEENVRRLLELLDICDFAKYAPSHSDEGFAAHHAEAVEVLSNIEERI